MASGLYSSKGGGQKGWRLLAKTEVLLAVWHPDDLVTFISDLTTHCSGHFVFFVYEVLMAVRTMGRLSLKSEN